MVVDPTEQQGTPEHEKMRSRMIVYNNSLAALIAASEQQQALRLHYVVEKPEFADPPGEIVEHVLAFVSIPAEARGMIPPGDESVLPKTMGECKMGGDISMFGLTGRARLASADVHVEFKVLNNDDSYFSAACKAFAEPSRRSAYYISRLPHVRIGYGIRLPVEVFVIREDSPFLPTVEDSMVRLFWPHAFAEASDYDPITQGIVQYGNFNAFLAALITAILQEQKTTLTFDAPIPVDHPATITELYPSLQNGRYRDEVLNMDRQWLAYLGHVGSRSGQPLNSSGSGMRTSLPRFSIAEFGSKQFWSSLSDSDDLVHGGNCLAARFLVDMRLARPESATNYRTCVAQKTVGPELP